MKKSVLHSHFKKFEDLHSDLYLEETQKHVFSSEFRKIF